MDKRLKKMTAIFFLAAAADLFLAAVLLASLARQRAEGAAAPGTGRVVEDGGWDGLGTEEAGAVALTFDDCPDIRRLFWTALRSGRSGHRFSWWASASKGTRIL